MELAPCWIHSLNGQIHLNEDDGLRPKPLWNTRIGIVQGLPKLEPHISFSFSEYFCIVQLTDATQDAITLYSNLSLLYSMYCVYHRITIISYLRSTFIRFNRSHSLHVSKELVDIQTAKKTFGILGEQRLSSVLPTASPIFFVDFIV